MAWSTASRKARLTAEKSKSMSFTVRVEDRLHENVLQEQLDKCFFTVRPESFTLAMTDDDLTVGTESEVGNGIRAEADIVEDVNGELVFQFNIQAGALNLDPELEYWYDVSYVRDGYSMSVLAGVFEVVANVANRTAQEVFTDPSTIHEIVAEVQGNTTIVVSASMPLPQRGEAGNGSYVVPLALPETVGASTEIPVALIPAPNNRPVQTGDIIFSSISLGVFATVQAISSGAAPQALVVTRQMFARETLKALLDVQFRQTPVGGGSNLETIDFVWTMPKSDVPLPSGYVHRIGDMVFSHSGASNFALSRKLLISLVEDVGATNLTVRTKVVFPIFLEADSGMHELLQGLVPVERTVNDKPLESDITLTADDIPDGTAAVRFSATQRAKLNSLPTGPDLTQALSQKAAWTHDHSIAQVTGLSNSLAARPTATNVSALWMGTMSQYNAITSKNSSTLYFIRGS